NCEHLLAGAAALAMVLERSCARLVILATSREGLGIDGERLIPVPPLAAPGADADLETITDAEAVRLFAERAGAVKPDFTVTADWRVEETLCAARSNIANTTGAFEAAGRLA